MSELDLAALIDLLLSVGTDTWNIEAKDASGGLPNSLDETLCAFANMPDGGVIVLGLAEEDGQMRVRGVTNAKDLAAGLGTKARDRIHPPVQLGAVQIANIEGKQVVGCVVPPQPPERRPFRIGVNGPAFTRSSDGDHELSREEELYLTSQRSQPVHDRQPVEGADVDRDLVPELLEQYLDAQRRSSRRLQGMNRDELLVRTNVVDHSSGLPTVAAVYAMGLHPQQFLPHTAVKAHARGEGTGNGLRLIDHAEFTGPVPDLLDSAESWARKHLMRGVAFHDGHGFDAPEIPPVALREVIANALVHRDLSVASFGSYPMLIKVPMKIIVESPGGLWGLTERELGKTSPRAKNAVLYRMCSAITTEDGKRVIEGHATGIPEVRRSLRDAFLPAPYFKDEVIKFKVVLTSSSVLSEDDKAWLSEQPGANVMSVAQKHALVAMRHGAELTNSSYRNEFPMDSAQARDELQELVRFGLAEKVGTGRGTAYRQIGSGQAELPVLAPEETEPNEQRVLDALKRAGRPLSRREIVQSTGLSESQVYRALKDINVLERGPAPHDGRVTVYWVD